MIFLTTNASNDISAAFERFCDIENLKLVKIHLGLRTTDTIGLSRLNTFVRIPPFWADLVLVFPSNVTLNEAHSALNTIPHVVSFSHPNFMILPVTAPNDTLYPKQQNLKDTSLAVIADINVEGAWTVFPSGGKAFVKAGVFDSGVYWIHEDFGYDGINPNSSKIEGWDVFGTGTPGTGQNIKYNTNPDSTSHGTSAAGIIGAIRNNISGVAGIAGGDGYNGNPGISLYSYNTVGSRASDAIEGIIEAARGGSLVPYGYGLHLINNSWYANLASWSNNSISALNEAVHYANRMQVTFVASRGNNAHNNVVLPATLDSCWVISVGGSGTTGEYKTFLLDEPGWAPSYGSGIDVVAPCVTNLIYTTHSGSPKYGYFNGTSAAAPHVSGVVGLLMSYMNDTTGASSYSNLAPEDCEFIINSSATDVGSIGYDSLNGYDRLNAGKALKLVEKPFNTLYHFGVNSLTPLNISVHSISNTITLTERYTSEENLVYNPMKYVINTYKIDATVSHHDLYPSDSIVSYWPRHSSSYVFGLPDAQNRLNMHERMEIVSLSASNAIVRGFVYEVWDTLSNHLGWWPCDTTFATLFSGSFPKNKLMEYSILSKNKAVGISELSKNIDKVKIFPNPTDNQQTITIENGNATECLVELYDVTGRFIRTVYMGKVTGSVTNIMHYTEGLPPSLYIHIIKLNGEILTRKFIKD